MGLVKGDIRKFAERPSEDPTQFLSVRSVVMRKSRACTVVCAMLLGGAAAPGDYSLIGVGTNSCGAWTSDRSSQFPHLAIAEEQWVLGFLSGMGFEASGKDDPLNGVDAQGVWAWLDNYCHANPLEPISRAAAAFSFVHRR